MFMGSPSFSKPQTAVTMENLSVDILRGCPPQSFQQYLASAEVDVIL